MENNRNAPAVGTKFASQRARRRRSIIRPMNSQSASSAIPTPVANGSRPPDASSPAAAIANAPTSASQAAASARRSLAEVLLERNAVQPADLEKAQQIQRSVGGRLGAILVANGAVSEDVVLRALADQLGAVYLLNDDELPKDMDVYRFMAESPIRLAWFLDNAALLWRQDDRLCCLARDIEDRALLETLGYFYPSQTIAFHLAANHHIDRLLDFVRKERSMADLFAGDDAKLLREIAEEAPIIELVNNLLAQAVDLEASDIHIEPAEESFAVRMRIDGVLHTRLTQPMDRFPAVASRIKLVAGIDIAERRLPQDGRISRRIAGKEMDIRVSTVPCAFGESVVLRLLAQERDDLALLNLGMEPDHLQMFRSWTHASNGIALVTGPTGSGKSTTLAAALRDANDGVKKIITVEDPIEYQMPGVTQIQAHAEIGYTFARALRHILRQDPDVVMIGEVRDLETADIAIRSALTGHVVLSTLHTNDAIGSFTRLIDMGVQPYMVAATTRGVQAQRLVRRACSHCATPATPSAATLEMLNESARALLGTNWVRTEGCDACQQTGYRGRMGIYELVPMSDELQDMVVAGASLNDLRHFAHRQQGHRTLLEDGLIKASHGLTTVEEVMRLTVSDA